METKTHYDYLIIGAGPAGLQLGYYLEQAKRDYLILEAGDSPGTFFKQFPRHRTLISINKVYTGSDDPEINLRWDWNSLLTDDHDLLFKQYSKQYFPPANELVNYLSDFASHYGLKVKYETKVTKISKSGGFQVLDAQGNCYTCRYLVIATGLTKPYIPPIPGIEHVEQYSTVSVNPEDFCGQRVLVIGKGNSGFEVADNLISTASLIHLISPSKLKLAWKTHHVGHLRAVNNNFIDTYLLKSQNAMLHAEIEQITYKDGQYDVLVHYAHADDEVELLTYDRVIACTGFQFDTTIFDESCMPMLALNDRFPKQTSCWESVNVPDLYFAGALMQQRDFKKKQSAFIHGFRYNVKFLSQLFADKYHGEAWPHRTIEPTPEAITQAIIERINRNSALWQQTNFFCDLIIVPGGGESVTYYEDLPCDYVQDSEFCQHAQYYTVTMDFGQAIIDASPDPLAIERIHKEDVDQATLSTGIHPWVRRYNWGELQYEHHVIEDLYSEFKEAVHVDPLCSYLSSELPCAPSHQPEESKQYATMQVG